MSDNIVHPPLYCCGEDTCPYDYCALEADELLESRDGLDAEPWDGEHAVFDYVEDKGDDD